MLEYGKTENIYARDMEADRKPLLRGQFRMPEVALVDPTRWIATEKIDGTNVRVILSCTPEGQASVELKGRSDNANLPKDLNLPTSLRLPGSLQSAADALWETFDLPADVVVTFYGEAYGAGIQKGGGYSDTKRIRVFDLMTSRFQPFDDANRIEEGTAGMIGTGRWSHAWRGFYEMKQAAGLVGLAVVPALSLSPSLHSIVNYVEQGFSTRVTKEGGTGCEAEGVVIRTDPYLFDGRGRRVMAKIKTDDLRR